MTLNADNLPIDRSTLLRIVKDFHAALSNTQYGVWADGFWNCLRYGHSSRDDDNTYAPEEIIPYTQYKLGAKAAELLLKCPQDAQLS